MRALHFMMIDFRKTSRQVAVMGLFVVLALFVVLVESDVPTGWVIIYMLFGAMTLNSSPFFSTGDDGFVRMLPSRAFSPVFGRYLYGGVYVFGSVGIGCVFQCILIASHAVSGSIEGVLMLAALMLGVGCLLTALEFLIYYCVEFKSAQVMSLIRMVVAFAVFFGIGGVLKEINIQQQEMPAFLQWVFSNVEMVSAAVLAAGVVLMLLSAVAAAGFVRKKYDL